jgi:hypothetical protein
MGPMRSTAHHTRERTSGTRRSRRRDFRRGADPSRSASSGPASSELTPEAPGALVQRRLANQVARYAPHDGAFPLRLPGTYVVRRSHMTTTATYSTVRPALCIVAQGAKIVMVGRDVLEYDRGMCSSSPSICRFRAR